MFVRWLLLIALLPTVAHAAVYKWQDASGKTQYSSSPPPSAPYDEVAVPRAPPLPPPTGAAGNAPRPAAASSTDAARDEACQRARDNLALLESDTPVTMTDPTSGKAVELDAPARGRALRQAQKDAGYFCDKDK